jgi:hypothetical protein
VVLVRSPVNVALTDLADVPVNPPVAVVVLVKEVLLVP